MVTIINFADEKFRSKQKFNTLTAKLLGGADKVIEYTKNDIDSSFLHANQELLKYEKGFGNYFWKAYIINLGLESISEGDYLFYADSGSIFLKSIKPLIDHMEANNSSMLCFSLPLIEKQWTKRDAFILMDCDTDFIANSPQIIGGFLLLRKNIESQKFIEEFMRYSSDKRVLSDDDNVMGKTNYPEFIAHRHDQSILSLLSKKHKILTIGDISDYGKFPYRYKRKNFLFNTAKVSSESKKLQGIVLCNRKENPIKYSIKYLIRVLASKLGFKI